LARIVDQTVEIRKIWGGFQASRVLITANNLRIFDHLNKQKTAGEIANKIKGDGRATEILLDALAGLGFLRKQHGRYKNAAIASRLLVSGSSYYQGDIIRHIDSLWDRWQDLDKIVKTGKPSQKSRNHEAFILGMHNLAVIRAKEIVREIGLTGIKKALDLGGGPGTYAIELALNGLMVTLFDLPETVKIARDVVSRSKASDRNIKFVGGDFLRDEIGDGYDLVLVSQILHMFSDKVNISLMKKCRRALSNNGKMVVQDFFINEARTQPVCSSLFAINMLVNTDGGRTYSPAEIKGWLSKAGFRSIRKKVLADGIMLSARK
jgi:ubiquinone/menaquinone biosynthesis C-methylase UbiE